MQCIVTLPIFVHVSAGEYEAQGHQGDECEGLQKNKQEGQQRDEQGEEQEGQQQEEQEAQNRDVEEGQLGKQLKRASRETTKRVSAAGRQGRVRAIHRIKVRSKTATVRGRTLL